jgi:hypothetical protein
MGIPAAQVQGLQAALNSVTVNAQAVAFADATIGAAQAMRDRFFVLSVRNERRHWGATLREAIDDVRRFRGPFEGMPAQPIPPGSGSWDDLRHAIGRAFNRMWSIAEDPSSGDSEIEAYFKYCFDVARGTIETMPVLLAAALAGVAGAAGELTGAVAAAAFPLWPIVAAVAAVAVVAVLVLGFARKEGVPV